MSDARPISWLIARLEQEVATFGDFAYPLSTLQRKKFNTCLKLLHEGKKSLTAGSWQRTGRRKRVQLLLADVYTTIGPDIFLLCTLVASISDLAKVDQRGLLPKVGDWWRNAIRPRGLTAIAQQLCDTSSLRNVVAHVQELPGTDGNVVDSSSLETSPSADQAGVSLKQVLHLIEDERRNTKSDNPTLRGECRYSNFSCTMRSTASGIPEPFRTGMQKSKLWKEEEEQGGLAITNCLSIYLPEVPREDAFFICRVGYMEAWDISDLLGFGDADLGRNVAT